MKELIIAQSNSDYKEFCPATKEHLRSALDNVSHNLGPDRTANVTIECRETGKSTTTTIKYRGPNQGHYPLRVAAAIINRVAS